jgi:hypothetical protein
LELHRIILMSFVRHLHVLKCNNAFPRNLAIRRVWVARESAGGTRHQKLDIELDIKEEVLNRLSSY